MAMRKVGSRRLVVDGVAYRWRIRPRGTHSQLDYPSVVVVSVELAEDPGCVLVVHTDRLRQDNYLGVRPPPVKPADVAYWVRRALSAGWRPEAPGLQFTLPPDPRPDVGS